MDEKASVSLLNLSEKIVSTINHDVTEVLHLDSSLRNKPAGQRPQNLYCSGTVNAVKPGGQALSTWEATVIHTHHSTLGREEIMHE